MAKEGEFLLARSVDGIMTTCNYVWTRGRMRRILLIVTWMLHNPNPVNY